jgi:hypothetical protein
MYNNNEESVIAKYYDKLYIINENDSIKYYYGKEYYNLKNITKEHCSYILDNTYIRNTLLFLFLFLYVFLLFQPTELTQEQELEFYERYIIDTY